MNGFVRLYCCITFWYIKLMYMRDGDADADAKSHKTMQ